MKENLAVNQEFLRRQIFWCGYMIKKLSFLEEKYIKFYVVSKWLIGHSPFKTSGRTKSLVYGPSQTLAPLQTPSTETILCARDVFLHQDE